MPIQSSTKKSLTAWTTLGFKKYGTYKINGEREEREQIRENEMSLAISG